MCLVVRLITGSYVSLYTYSKLRTNATWLYGGTHILYMCHLLKNSTFYVPINAEKRPFKNVYEF